MSLIDIKDARKLYMDSLADNEPFQKALFIISQRIRDAALSKIFIFKFCEGEDFLKNICIDDLITYLKMSGYHLESSAYINYFDKQYQHIFSFYSF